MASFNKIILVGNLTRDPQLTYTASQVAICKFGIATNNKRKDRDGNIKEEVCFVDCTAFGRSGETFNQYMTKGRSVLIEGRLHLNQWTTPEGEKRSKHEVVVENFTFLGNRGEGGGDSGEGAGYRSERGPNAASAPVRAAAGSGPGYDSPPPPTDDEIPF